MPRGTDKRGDEPVVFFIRKASSCGECGSDLPSGSMLLRKGEKGLCLSCADMDHLVFLPSGNTALTRRARKHSGLSVVVVEWSRSRKRYERQGVLVEDPALAQAEDECLADADLRAARREREAARREEQDETYVAEFARHLAAQYPGCPPDEALRIAEHACRKYSQRVGRSAAAKEFDPEAIRYAVVAAIRHGHTPYDELLMAGWDRHDARDEVGPTVLHVEESWKTPRV